MQQNESVWSVDMKRGLADILHLEISKEQPIFVEKQVRDRRLRVERFLMFQWQEVNKSLAKS